MLDALALSGDAGRQQAMNFLVLWCPWLNQQARDEAIDEAFERPRFWTSSALGDDLKLTWDEREAAKITTIRPAGATDEEMAERRRIKAAERMRENRRKTTLYPDAKLSLPAIRAKVIADILRPNERCTVIALCAEIKRMKNGRFGHLKGRGSVHSSPPGDRLRRPSAACSKRPCSRALLLRQLG